MAWRGPAHEGSRRMRHGLPWHIAQSGARVETIWAAIPPMNASEVAKSRDGALEALLHIYFLNRGILITPFHSMLLMCPATSARDVARYSEVFASFCRDLMGTESVPAEAS
jgi:glutamate-1-semialdehyde 2,1-aminomutase